MTTTLRRDFLAFPSLVLFSCSLYAQTANLYLLSGQGSDQRIFSEINWDTSSYQIHYIPYLIPVRGEGLTEYAHRIAQSIDTTKEFSLVGVSLGGMICSEIAEVLKPEKVIIISSAKCRSELPLRYRVQRYLPLYALIPKGLLKAGALVAQPLFEPDRKSHRETFVSTLKSKDKRFVKRSIRMIINWQKKSCSQGIIHLHGNNDHTLPIRNIRSPIIIENGSHMMTLTRAVEISDLLNSIL